MDEVEDSEINFDFQDSGLALSESDLDGRTDHHQLPAYQLAYTVGLEIHQLLKPFLEKLDMDAVLDDAAERLVSAYTNSRIPAAKIAGGNGMGYEDQVLCGHIVVLRKGFDACITAIDDITWLKDHYLPPNVALPALEKLTAVRRSLEDRIAELRARVWWD